MNTQTTITWIAILLGLFGASWGLVVQNKASATEEILKIQEKIYTLEQEKKQLLEEREINSKDRWIDEYSKVECTDSFTEHQNKLHDRNIEIDGIVIEIDAEIENEKGLILSR